MRDALRMAGLALRAGRLEAGEEPVAAACRAKRSRLVLAASDAAPGSLQRAERFAEEGQCLFLVLPCSKEELGGALGRSQCAMAAVTDLGLARAIAGKLAQADPERYGETARRLQVKALRAAQRREKTAKARQQRCGGKRPPVKYKKK